jgi:hypothetical protein
MLTNPTPEVVLPPYPKGAGQNAAVRLTLQRAKYATAIAALEEELLATQDAFTAAFVEVDERQKTRDRLNQLANANRQRVRRG